MPHGVLYIKTGSDQQWKDAFDHYGLSLSEQGLSQLMTPSPNKQGVTNKNIVSDGESYVQGTFYKDVRQVSLDMHMSAPSREVFLLRYGKFCEEVLDVGYFKIKTIYQPGVAYYFKYVSCNQYTEFHQQLAKFTLSVEEPNPTNRVDDDDTVYDGNGDPIHDSDGVVLTTNRLDMTVDELNTLLTENTQGVQTVPDMLSFMANATTIYDYQFSVYFRTNDMEMSDENLDTVQS